MEEIKYKVYVQVDSNNVITKIESDLTLIEFTDWIKIDEGQGDKYSHAQGNYFKPNSLRDIKGKYNYKLVNDKPVELTEEEKVTLFPKLIEQPTKVELLQKQLLETQAQLANLQEQILLNK
jgi:hypothetical protein